MANHLMARDKMLACGHGSALILAFAVALGWPRAGEAAMITPVGSDGFSRALSWATGEDARILDLDERKNRILVEMPRRSSVASALQSGLIPVLADGPNCRPSPQTTIRTEI